MPPSRSEVRRRLQNLKVQEVTQEQINDAAGVIYLSDPKGLTDARTLANSVHDVRTFGSWPDPGGGAVYAVEGTSGSLTPPAGAAYVIQGLSIANGTGGNATVLIGLHDGANQAIIAEATVAGAGNVDTISLGGFPIYLTNTLYLNLVSDVTVTFGVAYQVAVRGS
jgi:hypothetical protein